MNKLLIVIALGIAIILAVYFAPHCDEDSPEFKLGNMLLYGCPESILYSDEAERYGENALSKMSTYKPL